MFTKPDPTTRNDDTTGAPRRRHRRGAIGTMALVVAALTMTIGTLMVRPDTTEAAPPGGDPTVWNTVSELLHHGSFFGGSFLKDIADSKFGMVGKNPTFVTKLSDTKKMGFVSGTSMAMSLIGLAFPNPTSSFRNEMLTELDNVNARLGRVVHRLNAMNKKLDEIIENVEDLELGVRQAALTSLVTTLKSKHNGNGDDSLTSIAVEIESNLDWRTVRPEFKETLDTYFHGIRQNVSGPYSAARATALSLIAFDVEALDARFGNTPEERDAYYETLWYSAMYVDRAMAMGAELLAEYYSYYMADEPESIDYWLDEANKVRDDYTEFRRELYGLIGHPEYDTVWQLSVLGAFEEPSEASAEPDAVLGHIDVYLDGQLVETVDEHDLFFPGAHAEQEPTTVTLTSDPGEVPASGWALVARPADDGAPFETWSNDHVVKGTTTVDANAGEWSFIGARFAEPWNGIGVQVAGGGELQIWEEGVAAEAALTEGDGEIVVLGAQSPVDVVLTSDPTIAADADLAVLAIGNLVAWSPTGTATDATITVQPDELVDIAASFSDVAPATVYVTADGDGAVNAYRDGIYVGTVHETGSVTVTAPEILLVDDPDQVPAYGWVLVPLPGPTSRFGQWAGASTGPLIELPAGAEVSVTAEFVATPAEIEPELVDVPVG
ncbi:MAG: hypothetical protein AAFY28_17005 [Actinomycetota bacterium]